MNMMEYVFSTKFPDSKDKEIQIIFQFALSDNETICFINYGETVVKTVSTRPRNLNGGSYGGREHSLFQAMIALKLSPAERIFLWEEYNINHRDKYF